MARVWRSQPSSRICLGCLVLPSNVQPIASAFWGAEAAGRKLAHGVANSSINLGQPKFTRGSAERMIGNVLVNVNEPRFRTGRFGQAILIEPPTRNLLTENQSSGEADLTGFSQWPGGTNLLERIATPDALFGNAVVRLTALVNGSMMINTGSWHRSILPNTSYTFSVFIRTNTAVTRNVTLTLRWRRADTSIIVSVTITGSLQSNTWVRGAVTGVSPADAFLAECQLTLSGAVIGEWIEWEGAQLEPLPYSTSWSEGERFRAPELFTLPTPDVVNPAEGTIEFWWQPINQPTDTMISQATSPVLLELGDFSADNSLILWALNGNLDLAVRGNGATDWTLNQRIIAGTAWYALGKWYHIAVRWQNSNTFWIFVDGVRHGPFVSTHPLTGVAGGLLSLGRRTAISGHTNAMYDSLRISNIARTDAEIQASFASTQPPVPDVWTTANIDFDGTVEDVAIGQKNIRESANSTLLLDTDAQGSKAISTSMLALVPILSAGMGSKAGSGGGSAFVVIAPSAAGSKVITASMIAQVVIGRAVAGHKVGVAPFTAQVLVVPSAAGQALVEVRLPGAPSIIFVVADERLVMLTEKEQIVFAIPKEEVVLIVDD